MATERKNILWTESKGCALLPFLLFLSLLAFTNQFELNEGPLKEEFKTLIEFNEETINKHIGEIKVIDCTGYDFFSLQRLGRGTCDVLLIGDKGQAKLFVDFRFVNNKLLFYAPYLEHIEPSSERRTPLTTR